MSSGTQHLPTGVLAYLIICVFLAPRLRFLAMLYEVSGECRSLPVSPGSGELPGVWGGRGGRKARDFSQEVEVSKSKKPTSCFHLV